MIRLNLYYIDEVVLHFSKIGLCFLRSILDGKIYQFGIVC